MRSLLTILFCLESIVGFSQFKNIKLGDQNEEGKFISSPAVSINPRDKKKIAVATGSSKIAITTDGGTTWNESVIQSSFGFSEGPSVTFDAKDDLYFFHPSHGEVKASKDGDTGIKIIGHVSDDDGKTFSAGAPVGPLIGDQGFQYFSIHPKRQMLCATWTQFDKFGLNDVNCHSNIFFSTSTNGEKWTKPIQISQNPGDCLGGKTTAMGSTSAMDIDGKIFITWVNQGVIFLDRSYDGVNWITNDIGVTKQTNNWIMDVPGLGQAMVKPVLQVDNSISRRHGALYLTFSDQNNPAHDMDILFVRSLDRGDHWTAPVRINQDGEGKHQYMPWMSVDPVTGNIYIVYYDRRAYDDLQTDVYLAYSFDGGTRFKEIKISESSFLASPSDNISRAYIKVSAHAGLIVPVWIRMDNGNASVWTTVINEEMLKE